MIKHIEIRHPIQRPKMKSYIPSCPIQKGTSPCVQFVSNDSLFVPYNVSAFMTRGVVRLLINAKVQTIAINKRSFKHLVYQSFKPLMMKLKVMKLNQHWFTLIR